MEFDVQLYCVEFFRDNLEFDDYVCAAMVGCMMAESNLNPTFVNKTTNGVGLIQWKYDDRKFNALKNGLGLSNEKTEEILKTNGIQSLSLSDQLLMIKYEISNGPYKDNFNIAIRKTNNLKEAVATVYCRYINGFSAKTSIATESDIKRIDKSYGQDKSNFNIRLKNANYILNKYHRSIDI